MNIEKQCRAYSIPNIIDLPHIELPVETELLLPEYCPDIIKILKCDVKNRVVNKRIKDQTLELECCSEITILYCGDNNVLSSVITKYNYTKTIENKNFTNSSVNVSITNNNFNCRQTSARRIELKGSVCITVSINSFEVKTVLCSIDREDVEELKCEYETTSVAFTQEKQILIEDDLLLSSDKPEINYILKQEACATINECKQIGEKAVIKGNIRADILYCSVNNVPSLFSETIPFSQIIELNVKEKTCFIDSDVMITSFDSRPITSPNSTSGFAISVGLNIVLTGRCNIPVTLIKDCYSTKCITEVTKDKIVFSKLSEKIAERIIVKKNLTFNDNHISSVINSWCKEDNIKGNLEEDTLKLSGSVECSVLFCNIDNIPEYKGVKLDYEFNKKVNINNNQIVSSIEQKIIGCSYTLISENQIELQIEMYVFAEIYEKHSCEFVVELIDNENPLVCDDSIIIYYCEKDELVWDIAKRFSAPVRLLKEQNNIAEDHAVSQSVLVISRM